MGLKCLDHAFLLLGHYKRSLNCFHAGEWYLGQQKCMSWAAVLHACLQKTLTSFEVRAGFCMDNSLCFLGFWTVLQTNIKRWVIIHELKWVAVRSALEVFWQQGILHFCVLTWGDLVSDDGSSQLGNQWGTGVWVHVLVSQGGHSWFGVVCVVLFCTCFVHHDVWCDEALQL